MLNGSRDPILIQADSRYRKGKGGYERPFEGILPILERQLRDASGEAMRQKLEKYLELVPRPSCAGQRLRLKPSLFESVPIGSRNSLLSVLVRPSSALSG